MSDSVKKYFENNPSVGHFGSNAKEFSSKSIEAHMNEQKLLDIGQALKRFKKMMKMTGVLDEYRERRRYEKPSKAKYEARKRVAAITSMNDIRNIKRESKEVWVAILDGKAQ